MRDSVLPGMMAAASVLVLATGVGLWRRRRDGVLRPVTPRPAPVPRPAAAGTVDPADPTGAAQGPGAAVDPDLRVRSGRPVHPDLLVALGIEPGMPATLLQFSSAFCAPCRATRRVLAEVAETLPGVRHVEVDAATQPTGVRALGIWRTPTVLVVDAAGRVSHRAAGVPARADVVAAVAPLLIESPP